MALEDSLINKKNNKLWKQWGNYSTHEARIIQIKIVMTISPLFSLRPEVLY